jgi:hypothetical protein
MEKILHEVELNRIGDAWEVKHSYTILLASLVEVNIHRIISVCRPGRLVCAKSVESGPGSTCSRFELEVYHRRG